ncbi:MAG: YdeI/OmpD-associated family protein [Crocinitomicaceae bacterium]
MTHTFESTIGQVRENSLGWNFRIFVPDDVVDHFRKTDKRVICSINDSHEIHCALHSNGDGTFYLMVNQSFRKQYGLKSGDEVWVKIRKDDSKYGIAVPDFFEELCYQDPEASKYFHQLTPGKQRSLLHLMGKVKSEQKQLEKALTIFDYLKEMDGELDFKLLNEAFKNNRFKKI